MKLSSLLALALLTGSNFLIAGCATQMGHERTAGAVVDDATVTARVKSALLAEKDVNSFDIKVKTFEGAVQLSGFVDSQWQIDKAAQIASAVSGARSVQNDLIHKSK